MIASRNALPGEDFIVFHSDPSVVVPSGAVGHADDYYEPHIDQLLDPRILGLPRPFLSVTMHEETKDMSEMLAEEPITGFFLPQSWCWPLEGDIDVEEENRRLENDRNPAAVGPGSKLTIEDIQRVRRAMEKFDWQENFYSRPKFEKKGNISVFNLPPGFWFHE